MLGDNEGLTVGFYISQATYKIGPDKSQSILMGNYTTYRTEILHMVIPILDLNKGFFLSHT